MNEVDRHLNALKSNVRKMKVYWFCHSLIFAYVIERIFGLERGLSIQDMVKVEIFYAICTVLLEVPTGVLADRWNRRNTMILSSICIFFEFYLLIDAHSIYGFLASSFAAALGGALASGTANALLYDSLIELKQADHFEKALGQIRLGENCAGLAGGLLGAWAASQYGLVSTYYLSLIGISLAFVISLSFKEAPRHRHLDESETTTLTITHWQHMKQALELTIRLPGILKIIVYSALFAGVLNYVDEYYQIYAKDIGLEVIWFGVWLGFYMLIHSICASLSYRLKPMSQQPQFWTVLIGFSGLCLWFAAMAQNLWGLGSMLIALGFYWMMEPLSLGRIHQSIPSSHRATVESWSRLSENILTILIGLGFAWLADGLGIFTAYHFLAWLLVASVPLWFFWKQIEQTQTSTR